MTRGMPALLLVLVVACRDGPTQATAPMEDSPVFTPSAEVVATVVDVLNDPFVRELMDAVQARTDALDGAVRDLSVYGTSQHVRRLYQALTATRNGLLRREEDQTDDANADILAAALKLVLEDAAMLLEQPLGPEEGDAVDGRERGTPLDDLGRLER